MTTVTLKELRPSLPKIVDDIDSKFERVTVTKRGHPAVVMMSVDDYEGMLETMNILSDKSGLTRIKQGIAEAAAGRVTSLEAFRKKVERNV